MKILHIAPFNVSGLPIQLVKAEKKLGIESRLITLQKTFYDYEEDVCLNLPLLKENFLNNFLRSFRKYFLNKSNKDINKNSEIPLFWHPHNFLEDLFFNFRDFIWEIIINKHNFGFDVFGFDIYNLYCGLGFLRNGKIEKKLKSMGKKIVAIYLGSDLRHRGVIPVIEQISDVNFTVEFDHLKLHNNINYIFYPFDCSGYNIVHNENEKVRICHSPTNRAIKGSEEIIKVVKSLEQDYPVELVLLEKMKHKDVLRIKSTCDIMIDTLGELGYGYNSLESMAMGIATCTELLQEYERFISDHPFININKNNLRDKIIHLVSDREFRIKKGQEARKWVEKYHNGVNVVKSMLEKYRQSGWKIEL